MQLNTVRYAAGVEYLGTAYSGWQAQQLADSVQARVEHALSHIADHSVTIVAAGRTDAGVHARGQVIHFDSTARRSDVAWLFGANSQLPPDISLSWVRPVAADFHARFSALARRYRYLIHNGNARSAVLHQRAAWSKYPLDADCMHRAAQSLLGERDFSAFRAAECQSSTPMRCVKAVSVTREAQLVRIDIAANAFLHHMVRNIVGSLMEIGSGRQPERWMAELLAGRDRRRAGATAPAAGLYFWQVDYPAEFGIPVPSSVLA